MKTRYDIALTMLVAAFAAVTVLVASCGRDEVVEAAASEQGRVVVYAIGGEEGRRALQDEAEWEAMLDRFCDAAQSGSEVTFYSTRGAQSMESKGSVSAKEAATFSTTSRQEMKDWMKEMEKAGKTVRVVYDDASGTWRGTAYVNAPHREVADCYNGTLVLTAMPGVEMGPIPALVAALEVSDDSVLILMHKGCMSDDLESMLGGDVAFGDVVTLCGEVNRMEVAEGAPFLVLDLSATESGAVVGEWELSYASVTSLSGGDYMLSTALYVPELEDGGAMFYEFADDGTVVCTRTGSAPATSHGTWTMGGEGGICCDLLPYGGCWVVNWVSSSTMIISRNEVSAEGGEVFYQLQFDRP